MTFQEANGEALAEFFESKALARLEQAVDINQFRSLAIRTLTEWPDLTEEVSVRAGRFREPGEQLARLIELISKKLQTIPERRRDKFLRQALNPKKK